MSLRRKSADDSVTPFNFSWLILWIIHGWWGVVSCWMQVWMRDLQMLPLYQWRFVRKVRGNVSLSEVWVLKYHLSMYVFYMYSKAGFVLLNMNWLLKTVIPYWTKIRQCLPLPERLKLIAPTPNILLCLYEILELSDFQIIRDMSYK